ncbi:MAG: hypothetical protein DRN25_01360 [Thermoplasmata archaeon]|nr:MAG: hypothetical protein DRN25_01360 [Thermoplasmata archaeon]
MCELRIGDKIRGKKIREIIHLSNGWLLVKTDDSKSPQDFRVRTVWQLRPRKRFFTPKHAHFAIDFYGKLCADKEKASKVFDAIIEVWHNSPVDEIIKKYKKEVEGLPGYDLEYILYALKWILEQEDINFKGRPESKQKQLDEILRKVGVITPRGRRGSELAISLFCDIVCGAHPVEAFIRANLDVVPKKRL